MPHAYKSILLSSSGRSRLVHPNAVIMYRSTVYVFGIRCPKILVGRARKRMSATFGVQDAKSDVCHRFPSCDGNMHARHISTASKSESSSTIGFIGLGNMGLNMAKNLCDKSKRNVVCFDVYPDAANQAAAFGAIPATSVAEVAAMAQTIITMLPGTKEVHEVYLGKNGVLKNAVNGSMMIDCSTIAPNACRKVTDEAQARGVTVYDAPVSGGIVGAKAGSLTFMVGGPLARFQELESVLLNMGKKVVHVGEEPGSGQAAKICNNMLLAIQMVGLSEALNLGKRLGLDPKVLSEIINQSTGRCWSSDTYNPVPDVMPNVPSSNNYQGGFQVQLMCKDLGLVQSAATETQTPVLLGSTVHQLYRLMSGKGYGGKDFSSVYKYLQEQSQPV